MFKQGLFLLLLINPIALTVYLQSLMRELTPGKFTAVLAKASVISFVIFAVFALSGEYIFNDIYKIRFESFRIFGGILFFGYAFMYILRGKRSLVELRESLNDVASEIALPFMVGAGSISMSIIIGHNSPAYLSLFVLVCVIAANFLIVISLMFFRRTLNAEVRGAFDTLMGLTMRIVGFFVGAMGVDMVITGINNLYFS